MVARTGRQADRARVPKGAAGVLVVPTAAACLHCLDFTGVSWLGSLSAPAFGAAGGFARWPGSGRMPRAAGQAGW